MLAQSPALDLPGSGRRDGSPPAVGRGPRRPARRAGRPGRPRPRAARAPPRARRPRRRRAAGCVLVRGPGRHRQEPAAGRGAPARGRARGCRVLTARGSQLEKEFGFGAVRQLFEPLLADPQRRARAAAAARRPSARGVFDLGRRRPRRRLVRRAARPLLADGQPRAAAARWCSSSTTCSGATAGRCATSPTWCAGSRGCRCWSSARVRTGERTTTRRCSPSSRATRRRSSLRPGAADARTATAELVRRAARRPTPTPSFTDACHRTTSGNPLLLRQLLRALEAEGVPPGRRARRPRARRRVAGRLEHGAACGCAGCRRTPTAVARAVAVLGDGAAAAGRRRAGGAAGGAHRRGAGRAGPRPRSCATSSRSASCTRWCATPSTATCPPGERELRHERAAAGCCGAAGARASRSPRSCCTRRSAATRGPSTCCARAAREAADRGAPDSAVTYLRRALDEPPRRRAARRAARARAGRDAASTARPAPRTWREAYDRARRPAARAARSPSRSPARWSSPARRAPPPPSPGEAAASLPDDHVDERQALLALRAHQRRHARARPGDVWRTRARARPVGDGPRRADAGRDARAGRPLLDGARPRAGRRAGPLRARRRPAARRSTTGCSGSSPPTVRMLADDDLGDFWSRARAAGARARLAVRGAVGQPLGGLLALAPRRAARGAGLPARPRRAGPHVGQRPARRAYSRAFQIGCHLDRGDLAAARAGRRRGAAGGRRSATAAAAAAAGRAPGCWSRRAGPTRRSPLLDASPTHGADRQPGLEPVADHRARPRCTRSGRRDEAVDAARGGGGACCAAGARRSFLGAGAAPARRAAGGRRARHCARRWRCSTPTRRRVELARARCALGSSPGRARRRGGRRCCEAARDGRARAAPPACASEARAELRAARPARRRAGARRRRRRRATRAPRSSTWPRPGLDVREVAQQLFLTPGTVRRVLEPPESR